MKVVIIGAGSAIARELARIYARTGAELMLVARDAEKLSAIAADLRVLGSPSVQTRSGEFAGREDVPKLMADLRGSFITWDVAIVAHGVLPDQNQAEANVLYAIETMETNFTSVVSLCLSLALDIESQGKGTLAVITSVAGDRGRRSNYIYGAAKGGISIFLDGLRARLWARGGHVLDVKPGFVDTPMTAHLPKGPLFASATAVASDIARAIASKKSRLYTPWFWSIIMRIVRSIPESIFAKLKF